MSEGLLLIFTQSRMFRSLCVWELGMDTLLRERVARKGKLI